MMGKIGDEDVKYIVLCIGKGGRVAVTFENGVLKIWVNEYVQFAPNHAQIYELEDFLANWGFWIGSDEDRKEYFPGWNDGSKRLIIRELEIN